MLVLSRKLGERIIINKNIILEIVEIKGDKVRLGIVAPRDIPVFREEICTDRRPESLPKLTSN